MTHRKIICLFLVSLSLGNMSRGGTFVFPWRSTTAIVSSGQTFEVWFDADAGQTVQSVVLEAAYHSVTCSKSIITGDWEYDRMSGNRYDTRLTVTVPISAPADRYDLVLKTSTGDEISYGGVKVVRAFKDNYYIMHMSDGHVYQNGYDPEVLLSRKSAMIDIANIMDVQLIIETGDNMYNVRNHPDREVTYFQGNDTFGTKGMADAAAATFLLPGDHDGYAGNDWTKTNDQVNADFFNDYWGVQYAQFKYGNGRFMLFNNAWNVSTSDAKSHTYQVTDAVNWLSGGGSGGNFFLSAGHCYDKMHGFIDDVEPLDLVLAGDKHHARTDNPWPFDDGSAEVAYIAGSIRDHFEFNLYKVNNTAGTFTTPAGATAVADVLFSGDQNARSTWVPNMELNYTGPNDGTLSGNTATIINRYAFPIEGAHIRFVMPLGQSYDVSAGTIEQAFDGDTVHVVDVKVDLGADSTTVVDIFTAGMAANRASFVSWEVPSEMDPGETASVQITMKNTGLDSWTIASGQMLGSQSPADNSTWGISRVALPGTVATNRNAVFSFSITAPVNPGTYDLQWQMIDEAGDHAGWFGAKTPVASIKVGSLAPVVNFISPSGNVFLTEGEDLYVNVGATDPDGTAIRVRLYIDGEELSRSEGLAPYEWNGAGQDDPELRNLQVGTYTLTARATDAQGEVGEASINVTVNPPPENLVLNPSFEVPDSGWSFISTETSTATNYTGLSSLRLNALGDQARQTISIVPGTIYNFSFRVNTEGLIAQKFVADTQDVYDDTCQFVISAAESGWKLYNGSFEATTSTVTLRFFTSGVFAGTVYVDDVSLTAEYTPTAYDIWASTNGITGGPSDDDDGDGLNNFSEYAVREKPTFVRSSDIFNYIYLQRSDDPNLIYTVETTTNLISGVWITSEGSAETNVSGGAYNEVTHRIPTDNSKSFIQLRIETR